MEKGLQVAVVCDGERKDEKTSWLTAVNTYKHCTMHMIRHYIDGGTYNTSMYAYIATVQE